MGFVRRALRVLLVCFCLLGVASSATQAQPFNDDEFAGLIAGAGQALSAAASIAGQRNSFYRRAENARMAGQLPDASALALDWSAPGGALHVDPIPTHGGGRADAFELAPLQTASVQDGYSGWGAYLNANLAFSSGDTVISLTNPQLGFDSTSYGFTLGGDHRFSDVLVGGFAVGYTREVTGYAFAGDSNSHAVQGIFYGSLTPTDGLWFDGVLSAGWLGMTLHRPTAVGTPTGNPDSPQLWGGISGGYDFAVQSTTITPYARVNGGATWFQAFTETGPGAALAYRPPTFWSLGGVVGLRVGHAFSSDIGVIAPYLRGEYIHEFGNSPNNEIRPFAGPGAGLIVIVPSPAIDRNFFNVGGGLSMHMADAWSVFADYDGLFGYSNISRHAITGGVRKEF